MAMPEFTLRQLLEAGVHFGHHTRRWNPRDGALPLRRPQPGPHHRPAADRADAGPRAARACATSTAAGGRVLFVGTKRAAAEHVADAAKRCGQYYVNHRWLGGMLTNWKTITGSIKRLRQIDDLLGRRHPGPDQEGSAGHHPRPREAGACAGRHQGDGRPAGHPVHHRHQQGEAGGRGSQQAGHPGGRRARHQLRPDGVTYPIPGNDDAIRAITLYCDLVAGAVLDGISAEMAASGRDIGAAEELPRRSAGRG